MTIEHEIVSMPTFSTSNAPDWNIINWVIEKRQNNNWELVQILVEERTMIFKRQTP